MSQRAHYRFLVALTVTLSAALIERSCEGNDQVTGPSHKPVLVQSMDLRALGLTAMVHMSRQPGPGYVAVHLIISGIGTVPADQRLTFRFATHPNGESPPGNRLIVDVPVTIPQGSTTTSVIRYFPKWSLGHCTDMTIYEDGRLLEDSLTQFGNPQNLKSVQLQLNNWGPNSINLSMGELAIESRQDWLFIGDQDEVNLNQVPALQPIIAASSIGAFHSTTPVSFGIKKDSAASYQATGQAKLPTDWRGYQAYDVVLMNADAHLRLANNSAALNSLRDWILQGGTAVVYDAESCEQVLKTWRFSSVLNRQARRTLESVAAQQDRDALLVKSRAASLVAFLKQGTAFSIEEKYQAANALSVLGQIKVPDLDDRDGSIEHYQSIVAKLNQRTNHPSSAVVNQINVHPAGSGLVMTLGTDANQPSDQGTAPSHNHWMLIKRFVEDRSSPMLRQGTEPIRGHSRFRDWIVAGVLQPPVYAFMGILSLFVILVGPVAFWQTTKYGRSHLMFAIAPLLAMITTLVMLAYGVISDGFGTQVRVRQLTWVDGYSGDAGERVRATYFAGIRPSDGLRFPGHATVNRQAEPSNLSWSESNQLPPLALGNVTVRDDAQIFGSSFLPSRDQRQFIVHAPRTGIGNLKLLSPLSDNGPPKITSTFGFPLRELILRDDGGRYWLVEQLNAGGTETCVSLEPKAASRRLGDVYNDYRPVSVANNQASSNRNQGENFDVLNAITEQLGIQPRYALGTFEEWLSGRLQMAGEIPELYFVAISDVSDDAVAVEGSEIVDSVRYVFGTLR